MSLSSEIQSLNVRTAAAVHGWAAELERLTTPLVQRVEQLEGGIMASPLGPIADALGKFALEQPDIDLVVSLITKLGRPLAAAVEAEAEAARAAPAGPPPAGPIEEQARAAVTS